MKSSIEKDVLSAPGEGSDAIIDLGDELPRPVRWVAWLVEKAPVIPPLIQAAEINGSSNPNATVDQ